MSATLLAATTPRPHVVSAVHRQTRDVVTIDVRSDDEPVPFLAGQFDMLYAFGAGEAAISISSDPATPEVRSHTVRAVGWVTRALDALRPGASIGIRGPYGRPWPMEAAAGHDLLVVAGGIGLAPVRPAVVQALGQRDRFERIVLLVGARTPSDLVFRDDLAQWDADPRIDVRVIVDEADPGWAGPVGMVTALLAQAPFDPDRAVAFICGPEPMMGATARGLVAHGVAPADVNVTLERNMRCAVGTCGHCQLGSRFVCWGGPVFSWPEVDHLLDVPEL